MLNNALEAFLDLAGLNLDIKPLHTLSPAQARATFESSSQRLRWPVPWDLRVEDLSAVVRDGSSLALRLYRPSGDAGANLPVVLYFHGGGYVVGSLDSHDGVCRELAGRTRCAVLSVGYRLAPEHRFPTAHEDCADAVQWLATQGRRLGLDPARVVFAGDSAGATLATALAIEAARQGPQAAITPVGQLLCYPITDASCKRSSHTVFGEGYLLEDETLDWFYAQYAQSDEDRRDWRFSPLLADELAGLAPAIILLAGLDPLLDEGKAYAARLEQAGVDVECIVAEGLTHDLLRTLSIVPEVTEVYDQLAVGVRRWLQAEGIGSR